MNTSAVDMTPWEMLRQPSFYVIYLMMTMLAFGGIGGYCATEPDGIVVPRGQSGGGFRHDRVGAGHHG